ncbi:uncharacterized protein lrif1 isoform X2 [Halichoeres trimaculatus]|uniref:uncharacterized protein lrif1 isoform X2 n=1 Tax=Halichoeres trimaculatus TaxID=147232 RepID=UPI003D9FA64B
MNSAPSGSGIIYKAMPAVGADGQTTMKLIPVQTVKENLALTQRIQPKSDLALKTAETLNFTKPAPAPVDPCVTQFVRTQVSLGNVFPDKRSVDHKPLPPKHSKLKKVPQSKTPSAHCETPETVSDHHSVTEKLYHKQIQRVPAFHLPPPSDRHVFTTSANSSPGLCISPISPVKVDALPTDTSAPLSFKLLPNKPSPSGPKPSLKLIPQTPQRPNSPIRWTVEEDNSCVPPALPSPVVASEILRTLAEWERAHRQVQVMDNSPSLSSQGNTGQKEEDALVLCDGKVFRKRHPTIQLKKKDFPTTTAESYIFTQTTPISEPAQKRDVCKLIIQRRSHEVRDFCEGAQDEKKLSSAVTSRDEDVIFTSYTPPTLKPAPTEDLTPDTQTTAVGGTVQTREESAVTKPLAGLRMCWKKHSNMSRFAQQVACMEHSIDTVTSYSDSTCSVFHMDARIKESSDNLAERSWLKPAPQHISDHLLRHMFGITTDIKICLQRIDEPSATSPAERHHSEFTQMEVQHQEPTSTVHKEELFSSTDIHSPPESDSHSGSISVKSEEELSADSASLTSHTLTTPLTCSHLEAETKPKNRSGQSDGETDTAFGYMEPIDEDFISVDDKHKQDVTAGTREDKRRIRRTRKRTTCQCCISGAQNQALKLSLKTDFPGKKSGAKTARKRVRTSKRKSSTSVSCSSSEELRCHKEIRRLRELLREKEEALELLRRNSS